MKKRQTSFCLLAMLMSLSLDSLCHLGPPLFWKSKLSMLCAHIILSLLQAKLATTEQQARAADECVQASNTEVADLKDKLLKQTMTADKYMPHAHKPITQCAHTCPSDESVLQFTHSQAYCKPSIWLTLPWLWTDAVKPSLPVRL